MKQLLMLSTILSVIFSACYPTKKAVIFEATHNDKKFKLKECIRRNYISNYKYYELVLGNSKPIEVNSLDDEHGLPYRSDIFGTTPVQYFDTTVSYCVIEDPEKLYKENSAYLDKDTMYSDADRASIKKNIKEDIYKNLKTERKRFLLYLDPKKYTRKEFDDISTVLKNNIKEINNLIFACLPFNSYRNAYDGWQFCGVVYGNEDDFCETYTKDKEDFFKIFPDGRIAHYKELAIEGKNWMSGQDFIYSKILMPQKAVQLRKYTKADLIPYRNSKGESIVDNFKLEQGPVEVEKK